MNQIVELKVPFMIPKAKLSLSYAELCITVSDVPFNRTLATVLGKFHPLDLMSMTVKCIHSNFFVPNPQLFCVCS